MNILLKLLLGLLGVGLSACGPPKPLSLLEIEIRQSDFGVNGHTYATTADLTEALKKLPPPDGVALTHAAGSTAERRNQAIAAVKNAGIDAPIAWVGNEVFY